MSYVIYALFQVPGAAEQALHEITASALPKNDYSVFVRNNGVTDEQRASESDGGKGVTIGLGVGAVAGAMFGGVLFGPMGFLELPLIHAMGFGMLGVFGYSFSCHARERFAVHGEGCACGQG